MGDTTNKDRVTATSSSGSDTITALTINNSSTAIKGCFFEGVYSTAAVNVYAVTQDLLSSETFNVDNCDLPLDNEGVLYTQYTGFASVLSESATDSDLLYAITNGDYAVFGLVVKQIPIVAKF